MNKKKNSLVISLLILSIFLGSLNIFANNTESESMINLSEVILTKDGQEVGALEKGEEYDLEIKGRINEDSDLIRIQLSDNFKANEDSITTETIDNKVYLITDVFNQNINLNIKVMYIGDDTQLNLFDIDGRELFSRAFELVKDNTINEDDADDLEGTIDNPETETDQDELSDTEEAEDLPIVEEGPKENSKEDEKENNSDNDIVDETIVDNNQGEPASKEENDKIEKDNKPDKNISGLSDNAAISRFEVYPKDEKFNYLTGEQIIFYVGMSLSDESGSLEGSRVIIKIPKDKIQNNTFLASDISTQISKDVEETDTHFIVTYVLNPITSGTSIDFPIQLKSAYDMTPDDYGFKVEANVVNAQGVDLAPKAEETFIVNTEFDPRQTPKTRTADGYWSSYNNTKVLGGKESLTNSGYLSDNLEDLFYVSFSFDLQFTSTNANGKRRFDKFIVSHKIPEGSVFVAEANPDWTYDEDTRTVETTFISPAGYVLGSRMFTDPELKLKFPGAKINSTVTTVMTVESIQASQTYPEKSVITTGSMNVVLEQLSKGPTTIFGRKVANTYRFYDNITEREMDQKWTVSARNEANLNTHPDIKLFDVEVLDNNLDAALMYKELGFHESTILEGTVDVILIYEDGTTKKIASNIEPTPSTVIDFQPYDNENIKEVLVKFTPGSFIKAQDSIVIEYITETRDTEVPMVEKGESDRLLSNYANINGTYSNGEKPVSRVNAKLVFIKANTQIELKQYVRPIKPDYFLNEVLGFDLGINTREFTGNITEIDTNSVVAILPLGIEYIPGSSSIDVKKSVISTMENGKYKYEPTIIHNFKDTGQTALVWDLVPFKLTGTGTFGSVGTHNITYEAKVTEITSEGLNSNMGYLSWKNNEDITPFNNSIEDEYDLNNNGKTDDLITFASGDINYVPPRELIVTKSVKGSLDTNYLLPPNNGLSEVGSTVNYKFTLFNNSIMDITNLNLLDLLPKVGDLTVSDDITLPVPARVSRGSTFPLTLSGPIQAPAGYEVFYTSDDTDFTGTVQSFYRNATWTSTVSDFSKVTAFKIQLKTGTILRSGTTQEFAVSFDIPDDYTLTGEDIAVNTFGVSTTTDLNFNESNFSSVEISTFNVNGYLFKEFNEDGYFDSTKEGIFSNYIVQLVDKNGNIATDNQGNQYRARTDENGYYSIDVFEQGEYRIRVLTPAGYNVTVSRTGDLASHMNFDTMTDVFTMNGTNKDVRKNAGYYNGIASLKVYKNLENAEGFPFSNDTPFEFNIKIDGVNYNGPVNRVDTSTGDVETVTVNNGKISFSSKQHIVLQNMEKDSMYTITEIEVPGFTPTPKVHEGTFNEAEVKLTFINKVNVEKIDKTVVKEWVNGPSNRPTIEVQLYRNGEAYEDSILIENGTLEYTWSGLDKTDKNGVLYEYTVDEINVPDNYVKTVDGLKITNIYVIPKKEVTVSKVWVDGPNVHPTIEVQLYQNDVEHGAPITLVNGVTEYTWKNLDQTDKDGVGYVYTVDEVNVPENYIKNVDGLKITNTYVSPKTDITMSKKWVGGVSPRPTIEVQLYQNGVIINDPVELKNGELNYTWSDMDLTDSDGVEYVYTVDETEVPTNYTKSLDGLEITNTYVSPKTEVTMTKEWVGGPSVHPTIEVQLYRNDVKFGEPVEIRNGSTTYTWIDLDLTNNSGVNYVYTVDEVSVPTNYIKSVEGLVITNTYVSPETSITGTKTWINGPSLKPTIEIQLYRNDVKYGEPVELVDGVLSHTWTDLDLADPSGTAYVYTIDEVLTPTNYVKSVDGLNITNTYISPKTEVSMTKEWIGGASPRPTIEVQLYRNNIKLGDPVKLVDSVLSHTWTDLDLTDQNGNSYSYRVDEVNTPTDYVKTIDGFKIINKYVSPKTDVTMTKEWIGGPLTHPDITVQLYRDGAKFGVPILLEDGTTTYTWSNVDLTDANGVDYVYTVDELEVPENYTKNVDGMVIQNKYVSPETSVTMTKEWINGPSTHPDIMVQLYRDGVKLGDTVLLEDGTNKYTWEDLELTDENGRAYVYTVDEVEVPLNYKKSVSGLTITNTYVSPKTEVAMTKEWVGGPSPRPSIRIQLYRNNIEHGDPVTLFNGVTNYTWTNLDKTDANGVDYKYVIDELVVPEHYKKTVEDYKITNTYVSPKISIDVNKVWVNGPDIHPDVTIQLYRNDEAYRAPITLIHGVTNYTWTNLDKADNDGVEYTYTIDELNTPENYIHNVNGFEITNIYVIPKIDVTMNKKWIGGPAEHPEIDVQLYRDGVAFGESVTLPNGTTEYTWENLHKTDMKGVSYKYTVDEIITPTNYKKNVAGYTITNTYISPETSLRVTKEWINGPSNHPSIEIQLYRDDLAFGESVILPDGTTTHTWENIDLTDDNGVAYKYTVDEIETPENYTKNITGMKITNTYVSPQRDVSMSKVWVKGPSDHPTIDVQLYRNGEAYLAPVELISGVEDHTWFSLDITDSDGVDYVYTVDELEIPEHYTKSITGMEITNTYVSPQNDVSMSKVWVDGPSDHPTIDIQLYRNGEAYLAPVELISGVEDYTWTDLNKTDSNGVDYVYTVDEVEIPENYTKSITGMEIANTYVSPQNDVSMSKVWVDGPEEHPSIEVQLYQNGVAHLDPVTLTNGVEDYTWTDLDITDSNGVDYEYTVDELEIPEHYTKSITGMEITNTYVSPQRDVNMSKVWIDGPEDHPTIDIQLYRNGEAYLAPVELISGVEDYTWFSLDVTDSDGVDYEYTVDEIETPENYTKSITDMEITNTYVSPQNDVSMTKVWVDGPSDHPTINVQLYRNGEAYSNPVELISGVESYTWTDLDITDSDGVDYVYTVDEIETPENYVKTIENMEITNTYVSPVSDVSMTKVWIDGPEGHPTIDVQLYRNGEAHLDPITLVNGVEDHTWPNLDITDSDGVDYTYTIDEIETPDNYVKTINNMEITNTYVSPQNDVSMSKVWIDGPSDHPTIDIQLYRNGEVYLAPVELISGVEDHTWIDLDITDSSGVDYEYTIDEIETPENYVKTINDMEITNTYVSPQRDVSMTKVWNDGPSDHPTIDIQLYRNGEAYLAPVELISGVEDHTWIDLDITDSDGVDYTYTIDEIETPENYVKTINNMEITNTYVSPQNDVSMSKVWVDGPSDHPTIDIQLYRNGEAYLDSVTLTNGVEDHTWSNLDITDSSGVDYEYTIDELETPENYVKTIENMEITNTYVSPLLDVSMTKVWVDGPENHPTIDIQLYRNGDPYLQPIELLSGEETYTWTDLNQTDSSGVDYEYTIDELSVPENYIKSIEDMEITNTYVSPQRDVSMSKTWVDGPEDHPVIEIQLYRNGVAYLEPITLKSGVEDYTWTDLDVTDSDGVDYVYTVDELEVPENYIKSLEGLTITNTYISPKTEVSMSKVWIDGPEVHPEIDVQLYRNGEAHLDRIALLDGVETYTWTNLDLTDSNGEDYVYTVDEIRVPENYVKTIENMEITNTYVSPVSDVSMSKVWIDGPEEHPTIEIQLYRNGEAYLESVTLKHGVETYTWTDLDVKDSNGVDYIYTVDELSEFENYVKHVEDMVINNTYVSSKTEVSMNKVWVGGPSAHPTIKVQLYRNNSVYGEPVTLLNGVLTHTWTDLDQSDSNGQVYKYAIDEVTVPEDYEKQVDGFTIINTYQEVEQPQPVKETPNAPNTGLENSSNYAYIMMMFMSILLFLLGMRYKNKYA